MLPGGADAVIQIELVTEDDGVVVLNDDVAPGRNVRHPGEDLRAGTTVLERGTILGPAELGVAITTGRAAVLCSRRPRVEILGTGDELVTPARRFGPGQIHDSNTTMLAGARRAGRRRCDDAPRAPTTRSSTEAAIATAPRPGGPARPQRRGVRRPPRPRQARTWGQRRRGGLLARRAAPRKADVVRRPALRWHARAGPAGQPGLRLVTFVLFARPALAALQGSDPEPRLRKARLAAAVERHPDRDECVRVSIGEDGAATPTGPQASHILSSLLGADGLAVIPRGSGALAAGTEVVVHPSR